MLKQPIESDSPGASDVAASISQKPGRARVDVFRSGAVDYSSAEESNGDSDSERASISTIAC